MGCGFEPRDAEKQKKTLALINQFCGWFSVCNYLENKYFLKCVVVVGEISERFNSLFIGNGKQLYPEEDVFNLFFGNNML